MARILKSHELAARSRNAADAPGLPELSLPRRIGRTAVVVDGEPEEAPPAPSGVIRRADACVQADPLAVPLAPGRLVAPLPVVQSEPEPEPEQQAAEPEPDPMALLAEHEARWKVELQAATAEARAEGVAAGYAQAREELEGDAAEALAAVRTDAEALTAEWRQFVEACEPLLVELAVETAEVVLDGPLPERVRTATARALADAVERLAAAATIEIDLHPVDLLRLQESGVAEHVSGLHPRVRWEPNADLQQGDWVARSPDATIRHLRAEVLDLLRSRLGLLAMPASQPLPPTETAPRAPDA